MRPSCPRGLGLSLDMGCRQHKTPDLRGCRACLLVVLMRLMSSKQGLKLVRLESKACPCL